MSALLDRLSNLKKATNENARVEMTDEQFERCKAAIRTKNRGYNVQPNKFDIATPYRVAVNFTGTVEGIPVSKNNWYNFGNFKSVDVAAAVGTIVSAAFFGEAAVAGEFDAEKAQANEEFTSWMADPRNAAVIAVASGEQVQAAPPVDDDMVF